MLALFYPLIQQLAVLFKIFLLKKDIKHRLKIELIGIADE
jgi:hypothetical protein